ncbi:MAG: hypothetical protein ACOCXA_01305, partial [Planctomycetota bacterium]
EIERLRPSRRTPGGPWIGIGVAAVLLAVVGALALRSGGGNEDPAGTTPLDPPSPTTDGQDTDAGRMERAAQVIAELPADHERAMQALQRHLRNPYFSQDPRVRAELEAEHDRRRHAVATARSALRSQAEKQLSEIAALVAMENLSQAWERVQTISPEQQAVVEDRFQGTRQMVIEAAREQAEQTRTRIQESRNATAIEEALANYRAQVPEDLHEQRLAQLAERRTTQLAEEAEKRRRQRIRQRQQEDQQLWQDLITALDDSRGSGDFTRARRACATAAEQLHDAQRSESAKQTAAIIDQIATIENELRAFIDRTHPEVSIAIGSRLQRTEVLELDDHRARLRLLSPPATTSIDRDRPEIPYPDLIAEALDAQSGLIPATPHFLWWWRLPGGQAPAPLADDLPAGAEDSGPASGDPEEQANGAGSDLLSDPQEALALFTTDAESSLRIRGDDLHWSTTHVVSRNYMLEGDIATLQLRQSIAPATTVRLRITIEPDSLVLVGLRNTQEAIRLGLNAQRTPIIGAFITDGDRAIIDQERGVAVLERDLTETLDLTIEIKDNGRIQFLLDGQPWTRFLNENKERSPNRFAKPADAYDLIIQAMPRERRDEDGLLLHALQISD